MAKMLELIQRIQRGDAPPPPVGRLIGMKLVSAEPGHAIFELEAGEQHHNPMGTLHGGILCDLADAAMGVAYATTLEDGETFTTLELKINFLRPVWRARLTAVGTVVKVGRTVGVCECSVTDERERLIARASCTCMMLKGDQAADR
jgi:uncharacterized protein (TIGR00369 family)